MVQKVSKINSSIKLIIYTKEILKEDYFIIILALECADNEARIR